MARRGSIFDGILNDDAFRARMKALGDRSRRLAGDYTRRRERRVKVRGAPNAASAYARPVTVKVIYHDRARGAYPNSVAALAGYLSKEGPLFDRDRAGIDTVEIVEAWGADRRVFHVIVSPNDGHRIADMTAYGREIVAAWEERIGPLEWVAAVERKPDMAHPDGNQHLHVMVRGVQHDRDLFLDPAVVTHWLRFDAIEVTTDRLGYMTERERRDFERQLVEMQRLREQQRGREAGRDDLHDLGGREL